MCDQKNNRRRMVLLTTTAAAVLSVFEPGIVRAQTIGVLTTSAQQAATTAAAAPAAPPAAAAQGPVRQLTIDEAVALALEQNLELQVQRINPQIQDIGISIARTGWTPTFNTSVTRSDANTPPSSFLAGSLTDTLNEKNMQSSMGIGQLLPWGGGRYNVTWDSARFETTSQSSNRNPALSSTFGFDFTQPLLRNFGIDNTRQQVLVSRKNREISDVQLQQIVAGATRNVRNAYWDLVYALDNLAVQQQSLTLAQQSLKDNRARVEIGTMAPIDIIQAEAEVAQREESVILAEASIGRAEDRLRALIYDPAAPDFWTLKLQPSDRATYAPIAVDTDSAVRSALAKRTDLSQTRKQMELTDVNIRFFRNQTMPDVSAQVAYSALGRGGTQFQRIGGLIGPIDPTSVTQRSFGSVLGDAFGGDFPTWQMALTFSYPLGTADSEASLARARLQNTQAAKQLSSQELQVATQIRDLARSVTTNGKRAEATRAARALAEKRLESEEKKFQAGMTTSFFVVQAQRDLNQARNNELQAIIDHLKSNVDFETAQLAPLSSTAGFGSITAGGSGGTGNTGGNGSAVTTGSNGSNATSNQNQNQQRQQQN